MDDKTILFHAPRGKRGEHADKDAERLILSLCEYKGTKYVDARICFRDERGEYRPTQRGITIRAAEIEDVIRALQRAALSLVKDRGQPANVSQPRREAPPRQSPQDAASGSGYPGDWDR